MSKRYVFWLGVCLITVGLLAFVPLYFIELPASNAQIIGVGIGVILGWGSAAVSFYFGQSDKPKTEV